MTLLTEDAPQREHSLREVFNGLRWIVRAGAAWRMRSGPGTFVVEDGAGEGAADVTVSGSPTAVLRWVWNRDVGSDPDAASVEGAAEAVTELKRCIATATQ